MTREAVLEKLEDIFRDVFDDEDISINEDTLPDDIEEWDSIGHVYLITEVEEEFKIDLSKEGAAIDSVRGFIDIIMDKMK